MIGSNSRLSEQICSSLLHYSLRVSLNSSSSPLSVAVFPFVSPSWPACVHTSTCASTPVRARLSVRVTPALRCTGGGIFLSTRIYLLMADAGERLPAFTHTLVCGQYAPPHLTPRPLLYLTPLLPPQSIFVNILRNREAASLCPPPSVAATGRLLLPCFLLKMEVWAVPELSSHPPTAPLNSHYQQCRHFWLTGSVGRARYLPRCLATKTLAGEECKCSRIEVGSVVGFSRTTGARRGPPRDLQRLACPSRWRLRRRSEGVAGAEGLSRREQWRVGLLPRAVSPKC